MSNNGGEENVYHTEGFVKTISKDGKGVKLMVEVATPYIFESKEKKEDGSVMRKIMLVSDDECSARIYAESVEFKMEDCELTALLIAKANHMRVRLCVSLETVKVGILCPPLLPVNKLEIL